VQYIIQDGAKINLQRRQLLADNGGVRFGADSDITNMHEMSFIIPWQMLPQWYQNVQQCTPWATLTGR
jgi:hypothetical protein